MALVTQEVIDSLKNANSVYVVIGMIHNQDVIASALALASALKQQGKVVTVSSPKAISQENTFLNWCTKHL